MDGFRYPLAIGLIGQLKAPGAAAPIPQAAGPPWIFRLSAVLCRRLNAAPITTGSFCFTVGKRHGGAAFCAGWRALWVPAAITHSTPGMESMAPGAELSVHPGLCRS